MTVDQTMPASVLQSYADCCRYGDVDSLKQLFHEQAAMYGVLNGQLITGTPEVFYHTVATAPCPESSGEPYEAIIGHAEVAGDTATILLRENNYLGMNFTNSFHLLKKEGKWYIVSKLFQSA